MQDVLEGYAAVATADFIAAYEGLSPESIYEHVIDLLPDRSIKIADIGAGTGRDAAWLAAKGHDILAIEPVRELREAGKKLLACFREGPLTERFAAALIGVFRSQAVVGVSPCVDQPCRCRQPA